MSQSFVCWRLRYENTTALDFCLNETKRVDRYQGTGHLVMYHLYKHKGVYGSVPCPGFVDGGSGGIGAAHRLWRSAFLSQELQNMVRAWLVIQLIPMCVSGTFQWRLTKRSEWFMPGNN